MLSVFLSTFLLTANATIPPATSLSSSHAAYDGNALILTGHVVLDHGLGQMHAEHASLKKQEMGVDFPFSIIELQKDVILHLKNNARLSCATANLDFSLLKGFLFSEENQRVTFSDVIKKKTPVILSSNIAEITFSKTLIDSKKNDYDVETIFAKEAVLIQYNNTFILHADRALYRKVLPQDNKATPREFQGFISAYPSENSSLCQIIHDEDVVNASSIDIDLLRGKITMLRPKGHLNSSLFPRLKGNQIRFESEHLLWDQGKDTITLTGQAHVSEENVGDIFAEEELQLVHIKRDDKSFLKTIQTQGKTTISYQGHQLTSYGPLHLDRDLLTIALQSPSIDGAIPPEKQICYQEGDVRIYSDKADMEYSLFDGIVHPVSISLKDNIRLFSKNASMQRRWALADRLSYSPETRTFILTATPGKKVLFRDEQDAISVSAQEVHITYDPETKQEKVQGIGNVKLLFSSDEINLLKKMFPSYE